jgi:hypothetical protein
VTTPENPEAGSEHSHLETVPELPDEDMFTTIPVCGTCPEHHISLAAEKKATGWELELRHVDPCPRAGMLIATPLVPGCVTCHTWDDAEIQGGDLVLPGSWAYHPKHGRTPLTSSDGASGGDWCPQMEPDNERFNRVLVMYGNKPLD